MDVIQAAHSTTNVEKLARRIQAIYELSYEDVIPLPMCKMIAKQLVKLITSTACEKGILNGMVLKKMTNMSERFRWFFFFKA